MVDLMATNFHGNSIHSFSVSGIDKNDFSIIDNGRLILNVPADFESKTSYFINLNVTDEFGNSATMDLSIGVSDSKVNYFF